MIERRRTEIWERDWLAWSGRWFLWRCWTVPTMDHNKSTVSFFSSFPSEEMIWYDSGCCFWWTDPMTKKTYLSFPGSKPPGLPYLMNGLFGWNVRTSEWWILSDTTRRTKKPPDFHVVAVFLFVVVVGLLGSLLLSVFDFDLQDSSRGGSVCMGGSRWRETR